jgi:hypothetical protein
VVELDFHLVQPVAEVELRHRELVLVGEQNAAHGGMIGERHDRCLSDEWPRKNVDESYCIITAPTEWNQQAAARLTMSRHSDHTEDWQ